MGELLQMVVVAALAGVAAVAAETTPRMMAVTVTVPRWRRDFALRLPACDRRSSRRAHSIRVMLTLSVDPQVTEGASVTPPARPRCDRSGARLCLAGSSRTSWALGARSWRSSLGLVMRG